MNDYIILLLCNICLSIGTGNLDREIHLLRDAISRLSRDTRIMQGESGILKDDYTLKATKIRDIESKVKLGDRRTVSGEWKTQPVSPGKEGTDHLTCRCVGGAGYGFLFSSEFFFGQHER